MRTWKILSLLLIPMLIAGPACNDDDHHADRDADHHQMNGHDEHGHSSTGDGDSTPSAGMQQGRWAHAAVGDRVKLRIRPGEGQPAVMQTLTVEEVHRDKVVLKRSIAANLPGLPTLPGGSAAPDLSEMTTSTYEVKLSANPWENLPGEMPAPGQVPARTGTETLTIDGKSVSTTLYEAQTPSIGTVRYWLSDQVPGQMVKMQAENGMLMEVIEFQKN